MKPNQVTAPNCRQALQFGCAGFFGRCLRWQRPFPAAVGEFRRSVYMTRNTLAVMVLMLGFIVHAGELKPIPDLQSPAATDEKRTSEIRNIGLGWWAKNRSLMAEESFRVAGYFQVARDIPEFASRGDRVWEVRVIHMHTGGPSGILWIHDKTAKILALGAVEKGKTEPVGPANGNQPIRSGTNSTSSAAGPRR